MSVCLSVPPCGGQTAGVNWSHLIVVKFQRRLLSSGLNVLFVVLSERAGGRGLRLTSDLPGSLSRSGVLLYTSLFIFLLLVCMYVCRNRPYMSQFQRRKGLGRGHGHSPHRLHCHRNPPIGHIGTRPSALTFHRHLPPLTPARAP